MIRPTQTKAAQNCVSILYSDPYSPEVSTLRFDQPLGNIGLGNG